MISVTAPVLVHTQRLTADLEAAGLTGASVALSTADVGLVYVSGVEDADRTKVEQVVAAHVPPPATDDRLAALEAEVRGMRERAAAASVTGGAATIRDAITGPPNTR